MILRLNFKNKQDKPMRKIVMNSAASVCFETIPRKISEILGLSIKEPKKRRDLKLIVFDSMNQLSNRR